MTDATKVRVAVIGRKARIDSGMMEGSGVDRCAKAGVAAAIRKFLRLTGIGSSPNVSYCEALIRRWSRRQAGPP